MLRSALTTPIRTDDAAGVVVVGTLVTLFSWTVVPLWLVATVLAPPLLVAAPIALAPPLVARGYFLRVVAGGVADGNAEGAPSFVGWGRLYRDGIRSAVLSAVLLLPLVALVGLGIAAGAVVEFGWVDPTPVVESAAGTAAGDAAAASALVGLLGGLVGVLAVGYLVAFTFVRPAALAVLATSGRLRDALHPRSIAAVGRSGDYAVGWILAMVTLLTGYALASPFVPLLVGIGAVFVVRVAAHSLYGRGAATVLRERDEPSGSAAASVDRSVDDPAEPGDAGDPGVSGDVGKTSLPVRRPAVAEVPAAVQVGRSVPLSTERSGSTPRVGETATGASETPESETASFEWGPPREEPSNR